MFYDEKHTYILQILEYLHKIKILYKLEINIGWMFKIYIK